MERSDGAHAAAPPQAALSALAIRRGEELPPGPTSCSPALGSPRSTFKMATAARGGCGTGGGIWEGRQRSGKVMP